MITQKGSMEDATSPRQHLGPRWPMRGRVAILCAGCALAVAVFWLRADDVKMQNGDHYYGRVLSLDTNTLVLRSDVPGTTRLPRGKVTLITLGSGPATYFTRENSATNGQYGGSSVAITIGTTDLSTAFQQ